MKLKETLTKENFWNRMMELYPNATTMFCKWIDEYKAAVNWHNLFDTYTKDGLTYHRVKFHDLPHAMQLGIWLEFVSQRGGCQFEIEDFFQYDLAEDIEGFFKHILEEEAKNEFELSKS